MRVDEQGEIHLEQSSVNGLRVLHVLDHSLPRLSGYTIRSRGIVNGQLARGMSPQVVTSPLHETGDTAGDTTIDKIPYLRTPIKSGVRGAMVSKSVPIAREMAVVSLLRKRLIKALRANAFDLIHAHSPVLCGLAALQAAHAVGVPFVYEIRAFWEDAAVDQGRTKTGSLRYVLTRKLETHVVKRADAVVGIAHSIIDELKARGIDAAKIFHVPNGVDVDRFSPQAPDKELQKKLGLGDVPVFGFIGSLYYFEGVSWLVRAAAELHRQGQKFKLMLIGHGEDAPALEAAIKECGAQDYVFFLGKIPHGEIGKYYSLIDVMVYPRKSIRLTELVTPLKPLEAMAQEKTVLGSSVGGIRELVEHEQTGLLFKPESVEDFCAQASRLLASPELSKKLAKQGRAMVLETKDWKAITARYEEIYRFALTAHAASR